MSYTPYFSHFLFFLGGFDMVIVKTSEKFERIDNMIWKRTKVDAKGRVCLPQKLRCRLDLKHHSEILWISMHQKSDKKNEFIIKVGVKK